MREVLRRVPLVADLADAELVRIYDSARRQHVPAGGVVAAEGEPGDALYVVLSGELEITKRRSGEDLVLAVTGPGEIVGEMALLEEAPRSATIRALRDSELLVIEPAEFRALLARSPTASTRILRMVSTRHRSTEASLMERAKLASLGRMAAGLAHELNNPASAVGRGAAHMRVALADWQRRTAALAGLELTPEQAAKLAEVQAAADSCDPVGAGAVACSFEEERLAEWLEARGLDAAWDAAPALVAYGWDVGRLEGLALELGHAAFPAVAAWLAAALTARSLLDELAAGAEQISRIIESVKTYSNMDRAPVRPVDVHVCIEDTLTVLRPRLAGGIEVVRDYAADLPRIEANGGELAQVWTHLIGNAIDAMGGRGTLAIRTRRSGDGVVVEVTDSGPGIPPEVKPRIFDPFFTTKPTGAGAGLGLHIAHNIVVDRHRGWMRVDSEPGRTTVRAGIPAVLRRPAPSGSAQD